MGKLAVIKNSQNSASVADFINGITEEQKRKDWFSHFILGFGVMG